MLNNIKVSMKKNKLALDMKRFNLEISLADHTIIKAFAAVRNITMREYILQSVATRIREDKRHQ